MSITSSQAPVCQTVTQPSDTTDHGLFPGVRCPTSSNIMSDGQNALALHCGTVYLGQLVSISRFVDTHITPLEFRANCRPDFAEANTICPPDSLVARNETRNSGACHGPIHIAGTAQHLPVMPPMLIADQLQ
ncbi:hypothetical protein QBC40DRAFT_297244 [Triangularia verruculosa]|uniref:Uncharacterized protein n=1 Tax=Triangularia verruculosa TaxID=2587418 RepID=A0AAN7AUK8_9PEZI|nr:hypothetical protein QBC40DRAFT_297244 [Triangularia verruculosa]